MVFLWLVHKPWTCSHSSWRAGPALSSLLVSAVAHLSWNVPELAAITLQPALLIFPLFRQIPSRWLMLPFKVHVRSWWTVSIMTNDSPMCSHTAMQKQRVLLLLVLDWHCHWKYHPNRCLCVWRMWHWASLLLFWRSWSPPWESTALSSVLLSSSEVWEPKGFLKNG